MRLTDAQRELLEDKFVLWDRAAREGSMEMRDYNRRAADALKVALALSSEAPVVSQRDPNARCGRCSARHIEHDLEPVGFICPDREGVFVAIATKGTS